MTQTISVGSLFRWPAVVKAGEIIEFTGSGADARSYTNPITRETIIGADGNPVKWRATVTADVTLDGSGEGDLVVTGPAIYEADGQYNNISAALDNGDVFNILGSSATQYQPNLFFCERRLFGRIREAPEAFLDRRTRNHRKRDCDPGLQVHATATRTRKRSVLTVSPPSLAAIP